MDSMALIESSAPSPAIRAADLVSMQGRSRSSSFTGYPWCPLLPACRPGPDEQERTFPGAEVERLRPVCVEGRTIINVTVSLSADLVEPVSETSLALANAALHQRGDQR